MTIKNIEVVFLAEDEYTNLMSAHGLLNHIGLSATDPDTARLAIEAANTVARLLRSVHIDAEE